MEHICNNILGLIYKEIEKIEIKIKKKEEEIELEKLLDSVYKRLEKLTERIKNNTVEIAFVGKSNVGKSTLLNAVFGENVAPKRNGPYTAAVVEYRYAEKYSIILKKPGCTLAEVVDCNSAEDLYQKLKEESTVTEHSLYAEAEKIIVKFPSALLKNGTVIYDTPGFGATKGKDDKGVHDSIVKEFLEKQCCDQIFWIFRGDNPTAAELNFVKEYIKFYDDSNRLIVNVDDDMPEDYIEEYKNKYLSDLKALKDHVLFVNGKCDADAPKLQKFLAEHIEDRRGYEKVVAMLLKRFCVHCHDLLHCHPKWKVSELAKIERMVKDSNKKYLAEAITDLKNISN